MWREARRREMKHLSQGKWHCRWWSACNGCNGARLERKVSWRRWTCRFIREEQRRSRGMEQHLWENWNESYEILLLLLWRTYIKEEGRWCGCEEEMRGLRWEGVERRESSHVQGRRHCTTTPLLLLLKQKEKEISHTTTTWRKKKKTFSIMMMEIPSSLWCFSFSRWIYHQKRTCIWSSSE